MTTTVDTLKEKAQVRIIGVADSKFEITTEVFLPKSYYQIDCSNGNYIVTRRQLNRIKLEYTWMVDF